MVLFAAATKTFKFQEKQIGKRAKNIIKKIKICLRSTKLWASIYLYLLSVYE